MSGDTMPYVLRGKDFHHDSKWCAEAAEILEQAWPGVTIKTLRCSLNCCDESGGAHWHGRMILSATFSGSAAALGAAELLPQHLPDLHVGKSITRDRCTVRRRKTGFCMNVLMYDGEVEDRQPEEDRIWNLMAVAIGSAVWKPRAL